MALTKDEMTEKLSEALKIENKKISDEINEAASISGITPEEVADKIYEYYIKPREGNSDLSSIKIAYEHVINPYRRKNDTRDAMLNCIVYDSENEIMVHDNNVSPIHIDQIGFHENNTLLKIIRYITGISDTYPEYALQAAFCTIATIIQRRLYAKLNGSQIFTNLWQGLTGSSGYARKSAAMSNPMNFVKNAVANLFLPDDLNPESLLEAMATKKQERRYKKDEGFVWEDVQLTTPDGIKRSQRTFLKDEVGQLFILMQRPTHAHFKDTMLRLHSCKSYDKELVSKKLTIESPYISMFWGTTPDTLSQNMTKTDIKSGWLARTLITMPEYLKNRMSLSEGQDTDEDLYNEIINDIKKINETIGNSLELSNISVDSDEIEPDYEPMWVRFETGVLQMLDQWAAERELYYKSKHDDLNGAYTARFQENAIRLAIIVEVGMIPEMTKDISHARIMDFKISKHSMDIALKLIDSIFVPYAQKLISQLHDDRRGTASTGISNDIVRVDAKLQEKLKIGHREAYRECNMKVGQYNDCIDSLWQAGAVEFAKVAKKNQRELWDIYLPPISRDPEFRTNYALKTVSGYECNIKFEEITIIKKVEVPKIWDHYGEIDKVNLSAINQEW
jgi:Protein of unknown function (DUF3987)